MFVFITAEIVHRIPEQDFDHGDGQPKRRVDLFVYCCNGDVVRFHPERPGEQEVVPHRMTWPCSLYSFDPASIDGVGRALHATPPGMCVYRGALQPAEPCDLRIIAPHLRDFSDYDVQACSWLHMQSFNRNFAFHGCARVDITAGAHYPCWLCMASPGKMRASIPVGVHRVARQWGRLQL